MSSAVCHKIVGSRLKKKGIKFQSTRNMESNKFAISAGVRHGGLLTSPLATSHNYSERVNKPN